MPGRKFSAGSGYRYGFNGQENSTEIAAGLTTAMYWEYDSRIGRRWNIDPILKEWESPYATFSNNPVIYSDPDGDDPGKPQKNGTTEGQKEKTESWEYNGMTNGGSGGIQYKSEEWYWHAGGLGTGKFQKNTDGTQGAEILTQAGWYNSENYVNVLKSTGAAGALADELRLSNGMGRWYSKKDDLSKFVGKGLNANAQIYLTAAAYSKASEANFKTTGTVYYAGFNVEDILGVGLLLKEGLKVLGTYAAKNLASRSIDLVRKAYTIGAGRNIGTLGGVVEGAGYYTIGVSGTGARAGTVGVPLLRRFTTTEVGGYDRLFDSEVKLLEAFAEKFHNTPNVKATLTLTSERQFCTSCSGVVTQFQKMFPNVKLNVINGVK
jgi:RHS repeat-associated protein